MGWFSTNKKGLTPSEMTSRAFKTGVHSKIFSTLMRSNSRDTAHKKDAVIEAMIEGAMASGYRNKKVAESAEVRAGLDSLERNHVISEKEKTAISKAIEKELNN